MVQVGVPGGIGFKLASQAVKAKKAGNYMNIKGTNLQKAAKKAKKFYRTINHAPFYETTIENAELIKVAYNTFIGTKIAYVNTLMEMCHHLPNTNVDEVMNGLKMCNKRIISDKYLSGGMGDGGGCHPRDTVSYTHLTLPTKA